MILYCQISKLGKKKHDSVDQRVLSHIRLQVKTPRPNKGKIQHNVHIKTYTNQIFIFNLPSKNSSYSMTTCREPFECFSGHISQHLKLATQTFITEHHPTVHMECIFLTRLLATNNQMECTFLSLLLIKLCFT
jgi:hypothetical protein